MGLISKIILGLIVCCSSSYAANETGLRALTAYDCGCPGQNASYICTVRGGVITVWAGTAFDCDVSGDEILLAHIGFQTTMGQCNNGAIVGYGNESVNNSYISRLDVRLSTDLQGQTVICSVDNGSSVTTLGNDTLIVSTPSVPPPPPERISTLVVNPQVLMFGWDQIQYDCPMLQYSFTSENCGSCIEVTPRVVSCTGFQLSSAGITCTFTVFSIVCGNITGPGSMQSANVVLKVPDAPTVQSIPRYLDGRIQVLIGLMTTFPIVVSPFVSNEIDGSVSNYTIHYCDSTFHSICGIASIPASSCVSGTCTHDFDILNNSSCPPTTSVLVSVIASNVFGNSPPSTLLVREGLNNLVDVNFDPNKRTITCTFLNQPPNIMKQCSANITYGENCESFLNTLSGMGTGHTVETQQLDAVPGVVEYCFLVTAKSNNVTVLVDGTLQNLDSQANNMTAIIVVPLVFSLLLLVLTVLVILGPIAAARYFSAPKSTVRMTFSVKDEPRSLERALKVFKDCEVNILGLNTHLHHANFDRNAGNGYKFNYIHCMCTNNDKKVLKDKLEAEIEGESDYQENVAENEAVPVTAVIKVRDSPGALWKAIKEIGDHGINIDGVNTRSDRESHPGYKDNYVRCCSSEGSLQKVHTELKRITGKEVKIYILDEEHDQKEKAIEYWVKDEVGALARSLQVVSDMGINISGVNLDHLPAHIHRTTREGGLSINFIECSIEKNAKELLFDKLRREYGAVDVADYEVSPDKLDEDPNYTIVKVTTQNEVGSLNRVLKAFRLKIHGVNILDTAFKREKEINYKHYHLEITATNDQETNLKKRLLAGGLAIDIKPFDLDEYQQADHANDVQNFLQSTSHCESEESDSTAEIDDSPTTRIIQFYVRDEVGTLANALQIFSELGINITKVNPAHLSQEHQDEFVACSCAKDQRESLIDKLKSFGATKAEFLPEKEVQQGELMADANYCVVKFSVPKVGSIIKVLKAFEIPDLGVKIFKINPRHIKVQDQYVECCCTEEEKTKLLRKLEKIPGVTHVTLKPESIVSERPTQDPNYCIIKYSIGDSAGILVKALKVFFDLNLNIIGVNSLNRAFDRRATFKYKHNHVVLVATDEQEEKLKRELLVTGLAIDVKPYKRIWHSNYIEPLQPGNMDRNDIALTSIRVQND